MKRYNLRISQIILLLTTLFALAVAVYVVRMTVNYRGFAGVNDEPTSLVITDVTKDSFKVAYQTQSAVQTVVRYGEGENLDKIATDDAGQIALFTHLSSIGGLTAGKTYTVQVGSLKETVTLLPLGKQTPAQAKVITGVLSSVETVSGAYGGDGVDALVVLETNQKYFAVRPDRNGNWYISWANFYLPDGTTTVGLSVAAANLKFFLPGKEEYEIPLAWSEITTITAGSPVLESKPELTETWWDKLKKIFFTFVPRQFP